MRPKTALGNSNFQVFNASSRAFRNFVLNSVAADMSPLKLQTGRIRADSRWLLLVGGMPVLCERSGVIVLTDEALPEVGR